IACTTCDTNQISVTTNGAGAHPMDGDVVDNSGTCAVRTFTCNGFNANIINNAGVVNGVNGTATLEVTCNEAGTAWTYLGLDVTQVECASGCKTCDTNQISVTTNGAGAHPMDGDVVDNSGTCAVRTFTCNGFNANIEINNAGVVNGVNGTATLEVTCNEAGTAWTYLGLDVTQVECASGCKTCDTNQISVTTNGAGAHPMDGDVVDNSGTCAVRTFTCNGFNANIEINGGAGVVTDVNGVATLDVTCNAAGTAWTSHGVDITQVECAVACLSCAANLISVTTIGIGSKPMDGDFIDRSGSCAVRTFTCTGTN
ncbi:hypothetical protein PFISCL1PPCAC_24593, partial [Pristionchus fissidentatus]